MNIIFSFIFGIFLIFCSLGFLSFTEGLLERITGKIKVSGILTLTVAPLLVFLVYLFGYFGLVLLEAF